MPLRLPSITGSDSTQASTISISSFFAFVLGLIDTL